MRLTGSLHAPNIANKNSCLISHLRQGIDKSLKLCKSGIALHTMVYSATSRNQCDKRPYLALGLCACVLRDRAGNLVSRHLTERN